MRARTFGSLSPAGVGQDAPMSSSTTERQLLALRLIRHANKGLSIKQDTLAEDLGRDQSTINRWFKSGVPDDSAQLVIDWAHTHGIALDERAHNMRSIDGPEPAQSGRLSQQSPSQEVHDVLTEADAKLLKAVDVLLEADASFRQDLLRFVRQRLGLSRGSAQTGTDNGP